MTERLPQRFRCREKDKPWEYGAILPDESLWHIRIGVGYGSFELDEDPWGILGQIIGGVDEFQWIDNDHGWTGDVMPDQIAPLAPEEWEVFRCMAQSVNRACHFIADGNEKDAFYEVAYARKRYDAMISLEQQPRYCVEPKTGEQLCSVVADCLQRGKEFKVERAAKHGGWVVTILHSKGATT